MRHGHLRASAIISLPSPPKQPPQKPPRAAMHHHLPHTCKVWRCSIKAAGTIWGSEVPLILTQQHLGHTGIFTVRSTTQDLEEFRRYHIKINPHRMLVYCVFVLTLLQEIPGSGDAHTCKLHLGFQQMLKTENSFSSATSGLQNVAFLLLNETSNAQLLSRRWFCPSIYLPPLCLFLVNTRKALSGQGPHVNIFHIENSYCHDFPTQKAKGSPVL